MGAVEGKQNKLLLGPVSDGIPSIVAAAHELKSPLALVRQLSLMLEEGELSANEQQRLIKQISLTSERALRLTSDLTKAARLADAMFELEPINPQQICEDVVKEIRPLFKAHNRDIEIKKRRHPLLLVANRDLLRRIIMNFSDNALNYTDGETRVEINIGVLHAGTIVRLGVRDYGPALPKDTLKKVGDKLICASTSIHARPQSSGLGLYISEQFAKAMNGEIGITRHHDGATFYVDLQASRQLSLL